ncbi:aldo/keto reductase [uncultured Corynebacterium sp.]|uniref:aldo/keto reductase n=1 Tax=uncultured Corynebacterium sp. TaxID=159447 RepID=UPI00345B7CD0
MSGAVARRAAAVKGTMVDMTHTSSPSVVLGTWSWGSGAVGGDTVFGNHLGTEDLKPVVDAAMAAGLTVFDTAPVYAMGHSETILGELLAGYDRSDYQLSTKFTPMLAGRYGDSMEQMLDASLERLRTDHVDMYWIHNQDDVERWTPQLIPLVESGKVRQVGVSNHSLAQIERVVEILAAGGVELSAVQNHYSLLFRDSETTGVLRYCHDHGIEVWPYMILEQGALTGVYNTGNPLPAGSDRAATYNSVLPQLEELAAAMTEIGDAHGGLTVAEVATVWTVDKGTRPIVGVTKPRHIESQVRAAGVHLTAEETSRIEELAAEATTGGVQVRGSWEKPLA